MGDRVFFYLSGSGAGIYVVGRVVSPAYAAPDEDQFGRWKVDVEYDAFVEPPLLRAGLTDPASEPVLADWAPFRGLQGTNFLVPEAVAARLGQLLAGRLRPIRKRPGQGFDETAHAIDTAVKHHDARLREQMLEALKSIRRPRSRRWSGHSSSGLDTRLSRSAAGAAMAASFASSAVRLAFKPPDPPAMLGLAGSYPPKQPREPVASGAPAAARWTVVLHPCSDRPLPLAGAPVPRASARRRLRASPEPTRRVDKDAAAPRGCAGGPRQRRDRRDRDSAARRGGGWRSVSCTPAICTSTARSSG